MLRPGRDTGTGARVHPLRQIGVAMTLLGLTFCTNAFRFGAEDYLALLFATGVLFVVLSIAPDSAEVRQQYLEVLHSRPISERTLAAATGVRLVALSALIAGVFGLFPHAVLAFRGRVPVANAVASLLALVAVGALVAVLWVVAMLVLLRWISVARFRAVCQATMLTLVLAVMALSVGLPGSELLASDQARAVARWLPSTWFARLAWAPDPAAVLPERLAALGLALAIGVVAWRGGFEGAQAVLRDDVVAPPSGPGRSLGVRLVAVAERTPLLRRRVTPPVAALARLVLAVTSREEVSRLKLFAPRVFALLCLGAGFFMEERLMPLVMSGFLSFSAVFEGLESTRQSADAGASWVLWKTPLRRGELLRGLWIALLLRYLALPLSVAGVLLALELHGAVALGLLLALAAGLRFAFAVGVWMRPGLPLAAEQRTAQSLLGFGLASGVSAGWALVAVAIGALGLQAPWLAVVVALLITGATMAARWSLELLAEERQARLEFTLG